jgi:hypothetical protein
MRSAALALFAVLALATAQAGADDAAARADALFRAGRDAMRAGDHDRACEQFRESDRLDPQPGTKLNLAACEEKRRKLLAAIELFESVIGALPAKDERVSIAKERVQALKSRLPEVTFELASDAPEGTSVRVGKAPARLGEALPLDPGKHEAVVEAPGYDTRRVSLDLAEGARVRMEVSPGPRDPDESPAPAGPAGDSKRTLGFVLGGVGVAGVLVGTVTGVMALGKKSVADEHCFPERGFCDQEGADANDAGRTLATVSTVGFVVGAVGLGAGAYLILTSKKDQPETAVAIRGRSGGAFLSLERNF